MRGHLADYLTAKARHAEARQLMARSERTFRRLARGMDDDRAYDLAGVGLADARSVRASGEEREAFERLLISLRGADLVTRLRAFGAVACADLPRPANGRRA